MRTTVQLSLKSVTKVTLKKHTVKNFRPCKYITY